MLENQISLIKDDRLRKSVRIVLTELPDYFWKVPASSTGKYHPEFSLGEGGLIRHSKVAVKIAEELFNTELYNFKDFQKDLIYASLIVHDGLKHGVNYSEYTEFEHPLYIAQFIRKLWEEGKLPCGEQEIIIWSEAVACHMGKWNTNKYSTVELPKPISELEKFVHLCDYLASRKFLDIKFNEDEII